MSPEELDFGLRLGLWLRRIDFNFVSFGGEFGGLSSFFSGLLLAEVLKISEDFFLGFPSLRVPRSLPLLSSSSSLSSLSSEVIVFRNVSRSVREPTINSAVGPMDFERIRGNVSFADSFWYELDRDRGEMICASCSGFSSRVLRLEVRSSQGARGVSACLLVWTSG